MRPGFSADTAPTQRGPLLPGEFQPLAPTPAASESGNGPTLPEKELMRQLILHYRWVPTGPGQLQRYNPHGRQLMVIDGGQGNAE
jgi:hypothetical protein